MDITNLRHRIPRLPRWQTITWPFRVKRALNAAGPAIVHIAQVFGGNGFIFRPAHNQRR